MWKNDKVTFHPTSLANICPLSWVECSFVCPSCHWKGGTFTAWPQLVQWRSTNGLSRGLCHGGALWKDLFSSSDVRSTWCAKLVIAVRMEATLKEVSNYPSSSWHADSTVVPFDLFNKGRLPPLPLLELSFTLSVTQLCILPLSRVRLCLLSEAFTKKNFGRLFTDSRGKKGCSLFNRMVSTPPFNWIFIYLPSGCHFGSQNPWRGKCIKPLTVFTCVGLMLMCEGRPGDGGWEIDHRWMSVRGISTSTTAFHALSSENPSSRNSVSTESTATYHAD